MKNFYLKHRSWWVYLLPLGLGIAVFSAAVGLGPLAPSNVGWISGVDSLHDYLGWQLFRQSPWSLPIGLSPHNGMDISSSIVYSDSIPLLAILFKLFGPFLPDTFQYLGIWVLLCCLLQAAFAWLLLGLFTQNVWLRLLGTSFLALAPPMLFQIGLHNALAGHFVILAALYLVMRAQKGSRLLAQWLTLLAMTAWIHSYLLAIVTILFFTSRISLHLAAGKASAGQQKAKSDPLQAQRVLVDVFLVCIVLMIALWQAGYFALGSSVGPSGMFVTTGAYGSYGANLAALFYAHGWSYFNPLMLSHKDAYESFFYLGMGTITLIPFALLKVRLLSWELLRQYVPLLLACIGLTLFSISNHVGFGPWTVTFALPEKLVQVASILRASARLFWPVYYFIILGLLYLVIKGYSTKSAIVILSLACLIQIFDTSAGYFAMRDRFKRTASMPLASPLKDPFWQAAGKHYQQVVRIPAGNSLHGWEIFASYAAKYHLATNSIFLSRIDETKVARSNVSLQDKLETGEFDSNTLYVLQSDQVPKAMVHLRSTDLLAHIDGLNILAPEWLHCNTCLDVSPNQPISSKVIAPQLEEQISFSKSGLGQYYLQSGQWASPEPWGVWATGDRASFAIPKPKSKKAKTLILTARALVNAVNPTQILQISVDGGQWSSVVLKAPEHNQIVLPITNNPNSHMIQVEFKFLTPKKPSDLGMGSDDRALAFGLQQGVFR